MIPNHAKIGQSPLWKFRRSRSMFGTLPKSMFDWRRDGRVARAGAVCAAALIISAQASRAEDFEFFEKKIRPIFTERCYECHSTQSKKVKGGFLLDSREGLLKGGETGPAIVPGKPEKSLLITAVRYADKGLQMS